MRKIYRIIYRTIAILILAIIVWSCSKNEEDISAPNIMFIYPQAGGIVQLQNNYLHIKVDVKDVNVHINNMKMEVFNNEEGIYWEYAKDTNIYEYYPCKECVKLDPVNKKIKMRLTVSVTNEFKATRNKYIDFYLSP